MQIDDYFSFCSYKYVVVFRKLILKPVYCFEQKYFWKEGDWKKRKTPLILTVQNVFLSTKVDFIKMEWVMSQSIKQYIYLEWKSKTSFWNYDGTGNFYLFQVLVKSY